MEGILLLVVAVALAYGVGCMGRNRKIGFGWAFFLCSNQCDIRIDYCFMFEEKGCKFC